MSLASSATAATSLNTPESDGSGLACWDKDPLPYELGGYYMAVSTMVIMGAGL